MKFNNVVAWSKGWYKRRVNKSAWWMDLAHCINNDGWTVYTKKDVVKWILDRFDTEPEFWKKDCRFGFFDMFEHFDRYYTDEKLDVNDKIILYFRSCLSVKSKTDFEDGGFKPANWVLPLDRADAWYDNGEYTEDHKPKFHFAEMLCDAQARVDEMFKDLNEQKPFYSFKSWDADHNFDYIESQLDGKDWKDVVVDLGSEIGCEIYKVSGLVLSSMRNNYIKYLNEKGDDMLFEAGRFSHSFGYDENKMYKLYIKHTIEKDDWFGDIEYTHNYKIIKIEEVNVYE